MINRVFKSSVFFIACTLLSISLAAQQGLTKDVNIFLPTPPLNLALTDAGNFSIGYGTENLPNSFIEIGYSPIKHIDIQSNYFEANRWQSFDRMYKVGLGGYYFFTQNKKRESQISDKIGLQPGLMFNAHFGYITGIKQFKFNGEIAEVSRTNYNGHIAEIGLHWITRLGMFQFLVGNSNIKYRKLDLSDSKLIEESFWTFIDYIENHNKFNLYTLSLRYNLAVKQGSIYYGINLTADGWGDTDFINEQMNFLPNFPNIIFGATLNIDKIFPKVNWKLFTPKNDAY